MRILGLCIFSVILYTSHAQQIRFDCPLGWEDFQKHCYHFTPYPILNHNQAAGVCQEDGAFLLSINSDVEHRFVQTQLSIYDPGQIKRRWWTSGRRVTPNELDFFWEGDGNKVESYFYWQDPSIPTDTTKNIIMYDFDGYEWKWVLGIGTEESPFVCKISKDEIYQIELDERGRDFGVDSLDPDDIPFGPVFIEQPTEVIYEAVRDTSIISDQTYLVCRAQANPVPSYRWFKTRAGESSEIAPMTDHRYTFISGKLVIDRPSIERGDDGAYQCLAGNTYGAILSNNIQLSFGYLQEFPKSPRAPISAMAYTWTAVECNPPNHYPAIQYSWYKNSPQNYIQTNLKPYIFISNNGRLYFSEVTQDDVGDYFCVVTRTGTNWNSGATSMPTQLKIVEGSPGVYEPNIPDEFPYVYPINPKVGDNIRMECWASGTSSPALEYYWAKVILRDDGTTIDREVPLPNQAQVTDHNRVLNIPKVTMYDAGTYECRVTRPYGRTTQRIKQLILQAEPYYVLPLKDQYVDIGTELNWRCEADGIPQPAYSWYKNGELLESQISEEDKANGRVSISNNVLTIKDLDKKKDDGMYQCASQNVHATRYSSAELKVMAFKPSFAKYGLQANQFATNQGNTTMICRPEAAPQPQITWFKNGNNLNPGTSEDSRVRQMPNGNLFISPVQKGDGGVYKCHASNTYGEAESTGNLTILDTVTISRPPEAESIPLHQARFLHCTASYNPQLDITYTWYHSGILLEFERVDRMGENQYQIWRNPNYKRGTGTNYGGLLIQKAEQEHEGEYTCQVESSNGDQFVKSAQVKIVGPPWEPAGVDIRSYTTTTATIRWKAGGTNGASIQSFVIEANNHWEDFWRIVQTNVRTQQDGTETYEMVVEGLRPFSTYQIRVRAENIYGTSVPSAPSSQFNLGPIKPDLYPDNISGGGGKVGDLRVTWTPLDPWEENGENFGYKFYWRTLGEPDFGEKIVIINGNPDHYVHLVGEANFYRQYEVALKPFNVKGDGPMSPIVRVRSAMGIPKAIATNVRSQPYNATACRVTWEPVADSREDMRGQLSGYKVSYWPLELGPDLENAPRVTYNGQMSEGMVIGLDPDRQYYFAVYVWNEAGNGPKSQWFIQRTLRNAPINQPVEVRVFRKSETGIHVYWRGVSTTQIEEPLEGYKVRIWVNREDIKFAMDYNAGKETDFYIGNLHPDVHYKLRVFGYSRGGDGTMSSPAVTFMLGTATHVQMSLLALLLPVCLALWSALH